MPVITIVIGGLLIGLGCLGYFGAADENPSVTALIPAFVGLPLVLCGLAALRQAWLAMAMHIAVTIGLLGFLMAGGRAAMKLVQGKLDLSARPDQMVSAMAVVCLVFVLLCVNSFIAARRRRNGAPAAPSE